MLLWIAISTGRQERESHKDWLLIQTTAKQRSLRNCTKTLDTKAEKALTKGLRTATIRTIAIRMSRNSLQAMIDVNFKILVALKKLCT
jgi:hypothetical protein